MHLNLAPEQMMSRVLTRRFVAGDSLVGLAPKSV